jgi:enoyl-CoA hydratase/carnithine racemase
LGGVVVEHHVDRFVSRHLTFDGIEKADELLMPVALHTAPDDLAFEDVEGGEQGSGAVALVIVCHRGAAPLRGGEQRSAAEATARLRSRMEVSRILHQLPKPTIAMINGPAAGAGLVLALACDLRIAGGSSAWLVTAFVRVGFSGDFGGSFLLARLVGTAKARELYFTGRPVEADEALSLGVVNRVVSDEKLATASCVAGLVSPMHAPVASSSRVH